MGNIKKIIISESILLKEVRTYFISSGRKNGFYTLKIYDSDTNSSYYIRTLSTDKQKAMAKAKELTGLELEVDFDLSQWGTSDGYKNQSNFDCAKMPFGKYRDIEITNVNDDKYLLWFYFDVEGIKYNCVKQNIEELIPEMIAAETTRRYNVQLQIEKKRDEYQQFKSNFKSLTPGQTFSGEMFCLGYYTHDSGYEFLKFSNKKDIFVIIETEVKNSGYGPIYMWKNSNQWRKIIRSEKYNIEGIVEKVETNNDFFKNDPDLVDVAAVNILKTLDVKPVKSERKSNKLEVIDVKRFQYGPMIFLTDGDNHYFSSNDSVATNIKFTDNKNFYDIQNQLQRRNVGVDSSSKNNTVRVYLDTDMVLEGEFEIKNNTFEYKGVVYTKINVKNMVVTNIKL